MPTLLIHIGAHKTGTTALQRAFEQNTAVLAAHGVTYPRTNWFHFAQHRLAFLWRRQQELELGVSPAERHIVGMADACALPDRDGEGIDTFTGQAEVSPSRTKNKTSTTSVCFAVQYITRRAAAILALDGSLWWRRSLGRNTEQAKATAKRIVLLADFGSRTALASCLRLTPCE
ncbi:hypothetical protein [Roseovarius salis]|uniref:hypothetical protein n=1 Tax=Roseovarius salis TaxID=3376063 RepID=UPI0037C88E03